MWPSRGFRAHNFFVSSGSALASPQPIGLGFPFAKASPPNEINNFNNFQKFLCRFGQTRAGSKASTSPKPRGYWSDINHHRKFIIELAQKLNYDESSPESWYSISFSDFVENGGSTLLLRYYNGSPFLLLSSLYPDLKFLPWKFKHAPRGLWDDRKVCKDFLDWIFVEQGFKTPEDWYKLTYEDVDTRGGRSLVSKYGSVASLVQTFFPELDLLPWKFTSAPNGIWTKENRSRYLKWLVARVGVKNEMELKSRHFIDNNGGGLLSLYRSSPYNVIMSTRTGDDPRESFAVPSNSRSYFESLANQRLFADNLARKLNFDPSETERWYSVRVVDVVKFGGSSLLRRYGRPFMASFLATVYPEVDWKPWRFNKVRAKSFGDPEVLQVIQYIKDSLGLDGSADWLRIDKSQLEALGVKSIIERFGGLDEVVKKYVGFKSMEKGSQQAS